MGTALNSNETAPRGWGTSSTEPAAAYQVAMPKCTCSHLRFDQLNLSPLRDAAGEESQPAFVGGHPADFIDVKIIDSPEPIPDGTASRAFHTARSAVIVSGDHVNKGYIDNEQANVK